MNSADILCNRPALRNSKNVEGEEGQIGPSMNLYEAESSDTSKSPVALVEEASVASTTTKHETMRRDMLQKYKEALKKREEARFELERLEHDAVMNGIPLIEDYVRDPLILDVKTNSIVNREIPTFERVYLNSVREAQKGTLESVCYPRQVSCPSIFRKDEQEETSSDDHDQEMSE